MIKFQFDKATCAHDWEQHLWEWNREYCPKCGSFRDKVEPVEPAPADREKP